MAAMTGANLADVDLPSHCLVQGVIEPRTGADGRQYGIHFEVRLPDAWEHRLMFQGGGGLDGFLAQAIGRIPLTTSTARPSLTRGYAVVSMDGGHQGLDASFAQDQQAWLDYAYAAIGKVVVQAKRIVALYYEDAPRHTYFMGCSNGGREAMIAAQRYPTEFDGIVAGNAGFRLSRAAVAQAWDTRAFMRIAPKDAQGRPVLAQAFSPADLALVANAIALACDALDGVEDGLVNNYRACRFDPRALQCRAGKQANCLSARQVSTLQDVFRGPSTRAGRPVYSPWPYDIGIAADGWRIWKLGFSDDAAKPDALNATLGADSLKNYFMTPPDGQFDTRMFDVDRDLHRVEQTGALNDATSTYLSTFESRSGKLLIFHGMADPVFSALDIMRWYEDLQRDSDAGHAERTRRWARLFMVPGMNHCGGGPALNDFDPLIAIEDWVERNQAPEHLPARGSRFPGREQPLCPYPQFARYRGGDVDSIGSYECAAASDLNPSPRERSQRSREGRQAALLHERQSPAHYLVSQPQERNVQ
jgi:feruloyl esterase